MAQLNGEQIYPAQLIYIPQVSSVRLRTNSGLPRALRKPMSHQVKLSSHLNFIPAALEAYKSASSSDLENNQPSKRQAMAGSVAFEEALAAWLSLFKPSIDQVQDCIEKRPPRISNGISELIEKLKVRNTDVYLVSGGFQQMIKSVALELGVPHENIFANQLLFGTSGEYVGFDPTKPTSRSGGKAVAVQHIRQKCRYKSLVMIGDGATDLEARQPGGADLFICYGGAR
ncbi:hypothetical protein SETIT_3G357500v2 [Setaria italica]|uniref:phosphoserine phosphatase n=1 Tax=Setaria italica TaxID=4555 RepID=A0A368QMY9_SETIT|nr:hypothetical protein SETIT_3G357500v2 [Setaria italica]